MDTFARQYVIDHSPYTQVYLVKDIRNHAFAFALTANVSTLSVMLAIGRELMSYYLQETKDLRDTYTRCNNESLVDEPIEDMKEFVSVVNNQSIVCLNGDNAPVELARAYLLDAISTKISAEIERRSSAKDQ